MSELRDPLQALQARISELRILDLSAFGGGRLQGVGARAGSAIRRFGDIEVAEVTVSEDHDDELTITEHPVEYGAAIADHAFKRPAEVRCRVGWSAGYLGGDVKRIYEQILQLQGRREPFTVLTGKREYQNMLVSSLRTQTNAGLEYTFLADISFRQIILVSTQTIPVDANINNLAMPYENSPTLAMGPVNPKPASMSRDTALANGLDSKKVDLAGLRNPSVAQPDILDRYRVPSEIATPPGQLPEVPTFPLMETARRLLDGRR